VFECFKLGRVLSERWDGLCRTSADGNVLVEATSSNFKRTQMSAQAFLLGIFPRLNQTIKVKVPDEDSPLNIWGRDRELAKLVIENINTMKEAEESTEIQRTMSEVQTTIPVLAAMLRPFSWMELTDHFHCRAARASSRYCHEKKEKIFDSEIVSSGELEAFTDASKILELYHEMKSSDDMSLDDVRMFLEKYLGVFVGNSDPQAFLDVLDTDGNGIIDAVEFAHFMVNSEAKYDVYNDHKLLDWHKHALVAETLLCRRFYNMLQQTEILKLSVSPLFRMVMGPVREAFDANKEDSLSSIRIFAGHDVTLLPLLYLFGAWKSDSSSANWPGYGSFIGFEIYQDVEDLKYFLKVLVSNGTNSIATKDGGWDCTSAAITRLHYVDLSFISKDAAVNGGDLLPLDLFWDWATKNYFLQS